MTLTWERADPDAYPVIAYLTLDSRLPIFKAKSRQHTETDPTAKTEDMFADVQAATTDEEAVETDKWLAVKLRLPYTARMIKGRLARGGDAPDWFIKEQT